MWSQCWKRKSFRVNWRTDALARRAGVDGTVRRKQDRDPRGDLPAVQRGLIETRPRFRPIVRKPDYATVLHACGNVVQHLLTDKTGIKNLYDSRVFIERALVREAALSARKEDIASLREALEENRKAIPGLERILPDGCRLPRCSLPHSQEPDFSRHARGLYLLAGAPVGPHAALS